MATFSIEWNRFTVLRKHDIDKDKPYLWVFGIVVDADAVAAAKYVVRNPSASDNLGQKFKKGDAVAVPSELDFRREVTPIAGKSTAGVVVVAWENGLTKDSVITQAYRNAADLIDEKVDELVHDKLQQLIDALAAGESADDVDLAPTDAEMADLRTAVEAEVTRTIKDGSTIFQAIPDHKIGTNQTILSLCEHLKLDLDYRFTKGSTDYQLEGALVYDDPQPPTWNPPGDGSIQIKHQEPKPTSTTRH